MRVVRCFLAALTIAACGGGGGSSPTNYNSPTNPKTPTPPNTPPSGPVAATTVQVEDNSYTPGDIAVALGATVTWNWAGGYSAHSVTFDDGSGGSGNMTTGTYPKVFNTAGKFLYHCAIHGAAMSGSVTVQ